MPETVNFFRRAVTAGILIFYSGLQYSASATEIDRSNFQAETLEATETDEDLQIYGSFIWHAEAPSMLFLVGDVENNLNHSLRRALRMHSIDTLVLLSPGGSMFEGLQLSGMVFDKGLTTYIPENSSCASACSFIFLAGKNRLSDGQLGVHQFAYKKGSAPDEGLEKQVQFSVSEVLGYLNEYETPPFVYDRMFTTPPEEMYFFTSREMDELVSTRDQLDAAGINSDQLKTTANNSLTAFEKIVAAAESSRPSVTEKPAKEVVLLVQTELNRLGCSVGKPDGVVGPASKRGLTRFAKYDGVNVDVDAFRSPEFLEYLKDKPSGFCPKPPPAPLVGKLSRDWTMVAKCKGTIQGAMSIYLSEVRGDQAVYSVQYKNSVGQYWRGQLYEGVRDFSLQLKLVRGLSPYRSLRADGTISSNRREATGRSSDGCIFYGQVIR